MYQLWCPLILDLDKQMENSIESAIYTINFKREISFGNSTLVCSMKVPESFLLSPSIKVIKMFKMCLEKDMREKTNHVIDISHAKLTREIAIAYMSHLKWRSSLEKEVSSLSDS